MDLERKAMVGQIVVLVAIILGLMSALEKCGLPLNSAVSLSVFVGLTFHEILARKTGVIILPRWWHIRIVPQVGLTKKTLGPFWVSILVYALLSVFVYILLISQGV